MRGGGEWEDRSRGPAEKERDGVREQRTGPPETPSYVAVAVELRIALGRESAGEKDSEKQQDDSADLARERGARRLIVPVPARAL
jgi:hypothetical protein